MNLSLGSSSFNQVDYVQSTARPRWPNSTVMASVSPSNRHSIADTDYDALQHLSPSAWSVSRTHSTFRSPSLPLSNKNFISFMYSALFTISGRKTNQEIHMHTHAYTCIHIHTYTHTHTLNISQLESRARACNDQFLGCIAAIASDSGLFLQVE